MFVAVVMPVLVVVVPVRARLGPKPLAQHRRADDDDEQPRGKREPGVELLRHDERDRARVTSPSAKTPAVWATVTVPPSMNGVARHPRVPTRYAATSAFP